MGRWQKPDDMCIQWAESAAVATQTAKPHIEVNPDIILGIDQVLPRSCGVMELSCKQQSGREKTSVNVIGEVHSLVKGVTVASK